MATSDRKQVVLAELQTELGGSAYTKETVEITMTSTMANGSLLLADNTEAAAADAATVAGVVDAPELELYEEGDVVVVSVVKRGVILNKDALTFSDAAYGSETLTALVDKGIVLQSATSVFE